MREIIPKAHRDQRLSHRYLNRLQEIVQRKAPGWSGSNVSRIAAPSDAIIVPPRHKQRIVQVIREVTAGEYEVRYRYFAHSTETWRTDTDANLFLMDATSLNLTFEVDDLVVAYWDEQRNRFIPVSGGVPANRIGFVLDTEIRTLQKGTVRKAEFGEGPNPGLVSMAQEDENNIEDVYNLGIDGRYCIWYGSLVIVEQIQIGDETVKAIADSDSATMVRGRATNAILPGGTGTLYDVVGVDGHYHSNYADSAYLPTNNVSVSAGMVVWAQLRPASGGGCTWEIFSVDAVGGTTQSTSIEVVHITQTGGTLPRTIIGADWNRQGFFNSSGVTYFNTQLDLDAAVGMFIRLQPITSFLYLTASALFHFNSATPAPGSTTVVAEWAIHAVNEQGTILSAAPGWMGRAVMTTSPFILYSQRVSNQILHTSQLFPRFALFVRLDSGSAQAGITRAQIILRNHTTAGDVADELL